VNFFVFFYLQKFDEFVGLSVGKVDGSTTKISCARHWGRWPWTEWCPTVPRPPVRCYFDWEEGWEKFTLNKCMTGLFWFKQLFTRLLVSLFVLFNWCFFFFAINNNELSRQRMLSGHRYWSRCDDGYYFRIRFDLEGGCFCGRVQYNRHNDNNSYNGLR